MPRAPFLLFVGWLVACSSPEPKLPPGMVGAPVTTSGHHQGPAVYYDGEGPQRFVAPLLDAWDGEAAMETLRFVDRFYREPGNEGYDASIDRIVARLEAAGFGPPGESGLEFEVFSSEPVSAWTPLRGRIRLALQGIQTQDLHQFHARDDRDRTMLPTNSPSCDVPSSPLAFSLEELDAGEVLVTDEPLVGVLAAAEERSAAGVLSAWLMDVNVDPTGDDEHLDAIHYGSVPVGTTLPCFHISPRVLETLRDVELAPGVARVSLQAEVRIEERPVRTVVATVVGAGRPDEVVACVAHVQEPGANDNGTGIAGLLEGALSLTRAIAAGEVPRPLRSVAFVWGDEFAASRVFLANTDRVVRAGISGDMLGASRERTGAICLLERTPDPGAIEPIPPDEHTPWGAGEVSLDDLVPNGLAVILRCALVDVGIAVGGWVTSEHPWEGGSDHDEFLRQGIPGVLLWHFTDFTYHTSLDRLDRVDPDELRRTCVALVSGAAAVADARPRDLKRYVESSLRARYERQGAVSEVGADEEIGELWGEWSTGARRWLADLCNGAPAAGR